MGTSDIVATRGYGRLPLSNIVPFTYRDGMTYANLLYEILNFTKVDLPEQLSKELDAVIAQVNIELGEMGSEILANDNAMKKAYADFIARIGKDNAAFILEIERRIMAINNRVGPEGIKRATLTTNTVLSVDPAWPNAHPIMFAYTQDSTGGRTVTLASNITGNLVVNPAPGSTTVFELLPDGKGGWSVIQKPDTSFLYVEDFHVPANGNDWQPAITKAVELGHITGQTVVLKSDKVYNIASTLNFQGKNVSIASFGAKPAIIHAPGQRFHVLSIETPIDTHIRYLSANQQINSHGWVISNGADIKPGMLVNIKSTIPWYFDPRTDRSDARKSEHHRVTHVEGNTVYFEDPSNDGYDITMETVELAFWEPIHIKLDNITVRGEHQPFSDTALAMRGITIEGAYEPLLNDVNTENLAYTGILMRHSYRPSIIGGHGYGSNYVGTGYGVQFSGCAWGFAFNRAFWNCRRGIDVSGGHIISRQTVIDTCSIFGSGRQGDGTWYGWTPDGKLGIQNFGFGSHGPADHTTYRNCKTANLHMPYGFRGGNETVEGGIHFGRTRNGVVALSSGSNATIRNMSAYSEGTYSAKNTAIYDGGANMNTRRADYFVYVRPEYDLTRSVITIQNIDAEVQNAFIYFNTDCVPKWWTAVQNVKVNFAPQGTGDECAVLWHDGPLTAVGYRWSVGPVAISRETGSGTRMTKNVNLNAAKVLEYVTSGPTD